MRVEARADARVRRGSGAGREPWRPGKNLIQFWLRMSQARVGRGTRCGRRRNLAAFDPHSDKLKAELISRRLKGVPGSPGKSKSGRQAFP